MSCRRQPSFRLTLVALSVAASVSACGGGSSEGLNAQPASGAKAAAVGAEATAAAAPGKPAKSRRAVRTLADIERERARERQVPAPIDRGDGPKSKKSALQAGSVEDTGTQGQWSSASSWPLNAIHAILTPDGKIMSYGTDPDGNQGAQLYYDVWNPATSAHSLLQHATRTDLFCNAQVMLPTTGQVLLAGGDPAA
ncbi:hypothetical protein J7E62_04135 [Variovorax paradoxus]|nr:hypothetical protein [Variovorax paradoxus]